ncbi:MAG: CusA/CzcA family heavy metal efflux transporter [Ignavibacteria bacterium]|nr:CusA/CzcA family heavy metal efflux transporter [Ignavibacteria bacterium]
MLNKILNFSLSNRIVVLITGVIIMVVGIFVAKDMEVDIFPDLSAPTVVVMTDANGMAPEEVEKMVTFRIETAVNGSPSVRRVRSNSTMGFSIVWVEFDWGTDIFKARQTVTEKLAQIAGNFPEGVSAPILAPQTSLLGEVIIFAMTSDSLSLMDLRTLADWNVKPRILSLGGVAQVTVMGGDEKQYQIQADLQKMKNFGITFDELTQACKSINENSNGGFFNQYGNEYIIRGMTRTTLTEEFGKSIIKMNDGYPVRIIDVADVQIAPAQRINDASYKTKPAIILTVVKQPGIGTIDLTEKIVRNLNELKNTLPSTIEFKTEPFHQANFIKTAISNVEKALLEGSVFVIIILFIFLMSFRTTFISLIAIPLSLLTTIIIMRLLNLNINTMSLGGMAIAIGSLVDDAIIDVENVFKRLKENYYKPKEDREKPLKVIFEGSKEIRASIINATIIIIVAFLPLFFLGGVEGRMLQPLGIAFIISLFASLIVSITITPVLCSFLISNDKLLGRRAGDNRLIAFLKRIYKFTLTLAFNHKKKILITVGLILLLSLVSTQYLGRNFLPTFNEGSLTIVVASTPGISLEESKKIGKQVEDALLSIPEVVSTARKTGRAELSEHSFGSSISEIETPFVLKDRSRDEFLKDVRKKLSTITGIVFNLGQPISHRIDHIISGAKTSIAIKLFGTDLEKMYNLANEIKSNISTINGVADLSVEQIVTVPQIHIKPNREMLARLGISMERFNSFVNTAFAGQVVGNVFENERSFDIFLRLKEEYRNNLDAISNAMIYTWNGEKVTFAQVAEIKSDKGSNVINRENVKRKIVISANVAGRDVRSVVIDIKNSVAKSIKLPENYFLEYGGQFESEEKASKIIFMVSIISLLIIFFLLYQEFKNYITAGIILINLPLALIGGIATVWISSGILSIPSLIGFITLFGIATRNGILMVSRYNRLIDEGQNIKDAVINGSLDRLNPVLMTALTAALALIPLVFAGDKPGNEIQSPMAEVILGGLISSTFLNLVILPIVFYMIKSRKRNINNGACSIVKYTLIFILSFSSANAQSYKDVLKQIIANNKEIKAYKEYLNSINIESRTNNLPLNPKVEYSFLSGKGSIEGNKQELIVSQPFEFPTVYFLKSDIALLRSSANKFHLKEFEKSILISAQNLLIDFIYLKKKVEELTKRYALAETMLKTVQIKFDKGDVGILELNKTKSALSIANSKLNMAKIEKNSTQSELVNINGGEQLQFNIADYWQIEFSPDFDSLFNKLKEADYYNKSLEEEKRLYGKKLSLAKSGWLPGFDIGYRQETESDFSYKGVRLQMSLPLFENTNKVPKAESELNLSDLKIQSYNSKFYIEKKRLLAQSVELKSSLNEQRGLTDFSQLELNKKSYELGHISLTQFYIDNTIYYEIIDSMLETEREYNKAVVELLVELTVSDL